VTAIACQDFGAAPDGTAVELYTLTSECGVEVCLTPFGATLQRLKAPDRNGELSDVVLGFPTLDGYITHARSYFGGTVGRYANRIAQGRFVLDGIEYNLSRNDGEHSLHGGSAGFSQRVWRAAIEAPRAVAFCYTSPSGEMGYAGTLEVEVRYTLSDASLRIDYCASTDAPTIINLTNHALWNLAGEGSGAVDGHVLTLAANRYTPVDDTLIPTGELAPVAGTPFDFTAPRRIGDPLESAHPQILLARGYDHNFVLPEGGKQMLQLAARLAEPTSGRVLEVFTTEPGLQVYTGNFLDGSAVGLSGKPYAIRAGIALETQRFPDSPNRQHFPSAVLRPDQLYRSTTIYRLTTTSEDDGP
jgi:aldose 1-epimerase